jgi:histidinol-phosphatase
MSDQPNAPFADDLTLALRLADEASALALECLRAGVVTSQKVDGSVVTDADVVVERMLVDALASHRPFDAILGEELGAMGSGPRRWILDPIDGTRGFIAGRADWGVHIALESDGRIVVGVVTRPASSQRWWASQGDGAYAGQLGSTHPVRRLQVSTCATLDDALVSGWLFDDDSAHDRLRSLPSFVEPRDLDDIIRVAEGHLDAVVDGTNSQIWDRAPLAVLVEEAGGRYRDRFGGQNLHLPGGFFTNGHIDRALDVHLADRVTESRRSD